MTHIFSSGTLLTTRLDAKGKVITWYFLRKRMSRKEDSRGNTTEMASTCSQRKLRPACAVPTGCPPGALHRVPKPARGRVGEATLEKVQKGGACFPTVSCAPS